MKIEALTQTQEEALIKYKEKILKLGYSTDTHRKEAEEAIEFFYARINKPKPIIFWCWSPLGNCIFPSLWKNLGKNLEKNLRENLGENLRINLRENLGENLWENLEKNLRENLGKNLRENLWENWHYGTNSLGWIAFYIFCETLKKNMYSVENSQLINKHFQLAQSAYWLDSYENVCFVSEKPIYINVIESSRKEIYHLHATNRMAIEFRDGYGLWMLNGVRVSKDIVITPAHELNPELILTEKNAEVRREIVRKIGIERICQKLKTETLDKWGNYELLTLPVIEGMRVKPIYLKMKNPSLGLYHLEGVPPEIKTCKQALAWRDNEKEYINPIQLT